MPVGFKNGTGGNVQMAIDAVRSSRESHWFPSVTKQGVTAIFQTTGQRRRPRHPAWRQPHRHQLRGRSHRARPRRPQKVKLPPYVVVDCSHANSNKDHKRQGIVAQSLADQIAAGQTGIAGVMLESHLVEGNQKYNPNGDNVYGQSITDACINIDETAEILEQASSGRSATPSKAER